MSASLLTTQQLFTPQPSGVGPNGQQTATSGDGTWLGTMLMLAAKVQLPTTSWQSGAPERTILAIEAVTFSISDAQISISAQGGFLQTAAFGSVTYVTASGKTITVPVTPDPSDASENPTGSPGFLDSLASNVYGVTRLQQSFAAGPLAIVNLKGSTLGPFGALGYHVANTLTGATYSNVASLTIPSSAIGGTGGVVSGVTVGLTVTIVSTVSAHGLSVGNVVYLSIPLSSGVSGLLNVFATVAAVTSTTFSAAIGSSGLWTAGGNVFLCTVAQMQSDVAGIGGNAGPGAVTTAITQNAGVFVSNVLSWTGSNFESNGALSDRCVNSLAAASPNGPSQAYVYFAETAGQILAASTPSYTLTNGPVSATTFSEPLTGIVRVMVASSTPASAVFGANVTPGAAQLQITAISLSNPAVVTCAGPTTLTPAGTMAVTIAGAIGTTQVNGTWTGTYVSANSFSIPVDTTLAAAYAGGGTVEGGDLGQIDQLIQTRCVPDNDTAIVTSALALPIAIVAVVAVPQANVAAYQLAAPVQINAQIASYPVGGAAPTFSVLYTDIIGALEEAGVIVLGTVSYVREIVSLSLNGQPAGSDVSFPTNQYKAVLASLTLSVQGV